MNAYTYPETAEQRRAGMAAFRAKMLAAKERALATQKLSKRDREELIGYIAAIKAAQIKHGEVQS